MTRQLSSVSAGTPPDLRSALQEIAREHASIFALVARFIGQTRSHAESFGLLVLLDKIILLVFNHYQTEEAVLKQTRPSTLPRQRRDHENIMQELECFRQGMMEGRYWPADDGLHPFDTLIAHHVREEDDSGGAEHLNAQLRDGPEDDRAASDGARRYCGRPREYGASPRGRRRLR